MQPGQHVLVRTNPETQFTGALAQNAGGGVTLPITSPGQLTSDGTVDGGLAAGHTVKGVCRSILVLSAQALDWEIQLWASAMFNAPAWPGSADPPTGAPTFLPLGLHRFVAADGKQVAGAGPFYFYVDGLYIPIWDADRQGNINLFLVNRNASAKTAGDGGAIQIQLGIQPSYEYADVGRYNVPTVSG